MRYTVVITIFNKASIIYFIDIDTVKKNLLDVDNNFIPLNHTYCDIADDAYNIRDEKYCKDNNIVFTHIYTNTEKKEKEENENIYSDGYPQLETSYILK